jgi:hypothetical protein
LAYTSFGPISNRLNNESETIPVRITKRHLVQRSTNHNLCRNLVLIPIRKNNICESSIPPTEGLKLAHLNIRSLRNTAHFLQLKELVRTNRIDVFTISETWLNTTVTNKKLEIDGYKLHRLDRLYKKGGGVCAYVRKNIKSSVIKELTQISDTSFHQLWINLQYKLRILSPYWPVSVIVLQIVHLTVSKILSNLSTSMLSVCENRTSSWET